MNKPSPVSKWVVCAICDLDWTSHGPDPTLMDCIRLLKNRNYYTQPYPWYHGTGGMVTIRSSSLANTTTTNGTIEYRTPKEA